MPLELRANVDGRDVLLQSVDDIRLHLNDFRPLFREIEEDFYLQEQETFDREGQRSQRWADLSPAYAEWKRRHYPGKTILVRTGELMDGLVRRGGKHQVRRMSRTKYEQGTESPVARFHQDGTKRMPRRRVIELEPEDEERWQGMAEEFVGRALQKAWR